MGRSLHTGDDVSSSSESDPERHMRDNSGSTACKRKSNLKNVVVLLHHDVCKNDGKVYLPSFKEIVQLRRPEREQFKKGMKFSWDMTEEKVLKELHSHFPILRDNGRLSCATAVNGRRRRLEFHNSSGTVWDGSGTIWNGAKINRLVKGKSTLYVLFERTPESVYERPASSLQQQTPMPEPMGKQSGKRRNDESASAAFCKCTKECSVSIVTPFGNLIPTMQWYPGDMLQFGPQGHPSSTTTITGQNNISSQNFYLNKFFKATGSQKYVIPDAHTHSRTSSTIVPGHQTQALGGILPSAHPLSTSSSHVNFSMQTSSVPGCQKQIQTGLDQQHVLQNTNSLLPGTTHGGGSSIVTLEPRNICHGSAPAFPTVGSQCSSTTSGTIQYVVSGSGGTLLSATQQRTGEDKSNRPKVVSEITLDSGNFCQRCVPAHPTVGSHASGPSQSQIAGQGKFPSTCFAYNTAGGQISQNTPTSGASLTESGILHSELSQQKVATADPACISYKSDSGWSSFTNKGMAVAITNNSADQSEDTSTHSEIFSSSKDGDSALEEGREMWFESQICGVVKEIIPSSGPIREDIRFCIILAQELPRKYRKLKFITNFEDIGAVPLQVESGTLLTGNIISYVARKVKVTVEYEGSIGNSIGFTCFEFTNNNDQVMLREISEIKLGQRELFNALKSLFESSDSGIQEATPCGAGGTGASNVNKRSYVQLEKILTQLVYKAAEINGREFLEMVFNTSAGRAVFNYYRKSSTLPGDVARANGHTVVGDFLEDVNERLSKEVSSEDSYETVDWLELKHAVEKKVCLLCTDDAQLVNSPDGNDSQSAYEADDEASPFPSPADTNANDGELDYSELGDIGQVTLDKNDSRDSIATEAERQRHQTETERQAGSGSSFTNRDDSEREMESLPHGTDNVEIKSNPRFSCTDYSEKSVLNSAQDAVTNVALHPNQEGADPAEDHFVTSAVTAVGGETSDATEISSEGGTNSSPELQNQEPTGSMTVVLPCEIKTGTLIGPYIQTTTKKTFWKRCCDKTDQKEEQDDLQKPLGHPGKVSFLATAPSSFASTKETTNFARLCRLLVDVGSQVLRSTFDKIHPPATLHTVLGSTSVHYATLQSLYRGRKKVLNPRQWGKLYPSYTPVSSAAFDIPLLTVLLRNICGLDPPASGWYRLPPPMNISIADDIARVNYYRNSVCGHACQASVDDISFSAYWHEIRGPLVRLGGAHIRTKIDILELDYMDPDIQEHYRELMKLWKKDDDSIKGKLEEMGDLLENISSVLEGKFSDATEKMEIEMTEVKEKLSSLTTSAEKSRQADQLKKIESQRQELKDQLKEKGKQRICLDDQLKETEKQLQVLKNEIKERVEKQMGLENLLERKENELQETEEKPRNLTDQLKTEERQRNLKDNFRKTEERRKSLKDQLREKEKQMKSLEDQLKKFEFQREVLSEQLLNDISPFCILPPKPSHDIASRDVEVANITKQLQELKRVDANNLSIFYIYGNPGSGKSQLAGLVAKRFYEKAQKDSCSEVFVMTLNAETLGTLLDSYITFARQTRCPEVAITQIHRSKDLNIGNKINSMISLISSKIGQYESWLLLADNVKSLSEMHVHLPQQGHGQWGRGYLLITTQDSTCIPLTSTSIRHISVSEGMQSQEACSLLAQISGINDSQMGKLVARALDHQPLELASAATYVKQRRQSKRLSEFGRIDLLSEVKKGQRDATETLLAETNPFYKKSFTTLTTVAVKEVMQSDRIIDHALSFLSLLSSQPLDVDIVVNYIVSVDEGIKDEELIIKKLQRCSLTLLHEDEFGFHIRVHQVVRDVVKSVIKGYPVRRHVKTVNSAIAAFDQFIDDNLPKESSDSFFQSYVLALHLKYFILSFENVLPKVALPYIVQPEMEKLGKICENHCHFQAAKKFYEFSLQAFLQKFAPDHPSVATSYNNLGLVHNKLGDFEKAKECHELALSIAQKEIGPENVQVAASYNNLGLVHDKLGDFERAKESHELALSIRQEKLGPENVQVAACYNNLGSLHHKMGDFEKAKEYHELALSITQEKLGPENIQVATSYNNLGSVHEQLGDFEKAKEYHELALSITQKKLGPENVQLAASYNNLGFVHEQLSDFEKAKEYYELALSITQKKLGPENVQVAASYNTLGSLHHKLGNFEKAKEYHELALSITQKKLGPENVEVATSYNLGQVHDKLGDFEKVKEYHELALSIRQKKVGPVCVNDASLPTTLNLVRSVYSAQGIFLQAECYDPALNYRSRKRASEDGLDPVINDWIDGLSQSSFESSVGSSEKRKTKKE